jgi:hypothetical protein
MGKSAGVLLAKKGANILIVARNVDKLKEATRIISVSLFSHSKRHAAHKSRRLLLQILPPSDSITSVPTCRLRQKQQELWL